MLGRWIGYLIWFHFSNCAFFKQKTKQSSICPVCAPIAGPNFSYPMEEPKLRRITRTGGLNSATPSSTETSSSSARQLRLPALLLHLETQGNAVAAAWETNIAGWKSRRQWWCVPSSPCLFFGGGKALSHCVVDSEAPKTHP